MPEAMCVCVCVYTHIQLNIYIYIYIQPNKADIYIYDMCVYKYVSALFGLKYIYI